jgi:hypothetical protein
VAECAGRDLRGSGVRRSPNVTPSGGGIKVPHQQNSREIDLSDLGRPHH